MRTYLVQPLHLMAASSGSVQVNDDYSGSDEITGGNALVRDGNNLWSQEW